MVHFSEHFPFQVIWKRGIANIEALTGRNTSHTDV